MKRPLLAAVLPALVLLGACGGGSTTADAPVASDSSSASPPAPSASNPEPSDDSGASGDSEAGVPPLLDFTATTVGGEDFDGASLAGSPTVLWFWAPWCPTCRSQVPQVEDLAATYGDRVGVVGIGSLDSAEAIAEFAGDVDGLTQLEDEDGVLWQRFGVAEQSSFVVLDADGKVAFEAGYGGSEDLASEVEALLG